MVAYSGSLVLGVQDVDKTKIAILDNCKKVKGFITKESNQFLILRIPKTEYTKFIESIKSIGEITESEMNGEDITDAYEDLVLNLKSKRALRERYIKILDKASKVSDMLEIEKELERIDLEIQQLEGKKIESEKRVEFVTLNIKIKEKITLGPLSWFFYILYKSVEWLFIWPRF